MKKLNILILLFYIYLNLINGENIPIVNQVSIKNDNNNNYYFNFTGDNFSVIKSEINIYIDVYQCEIINSTINEINCNIKNEIDKEEINENQDKYKSMISLLKIDGKKTIEITLNLFENINLIIECSNICNYTNNQYCNTQNGICSNCPNGRSGENCSIVSCSTNNQFDNICSDNGECNQSIGQCECNDGYSGKYCDNKDGESTTVIIVVVIVSIIGALVIGIVGVCFFLKCCVHKFNPTSIETNNQTSTKLRKINRTSSKLPNSVSSTIQLSDDDNQNNINDNNL